MKSALIAAVVAALVASGGTMAANRISGKAIQPHSIPANRLTASAVGSFIAQPTVASATGQVPNTTDGSVTTIVAQCPAGSTAIAGGYRLTNPQNQPGFKLSSNGPTSDGTGWEIDVAQAAPGNPVDVPAFVVVAACEATA